MLRTKHLLGQPKFINHPSLLVRNLLFLLRKILIFKFKVQSWLQLPHNKIINSELLLQDILLDKKKTLDRSHLRINNYPKIIIIIIILYNQKNYQFKINLLINHFFKGEVLLKLNKV